MFWVCCSLCPHWQFGLPEKLGIDMGTLQAYGDAVSAHYHEENPYHNALHGADVLLSMASQVWCGAWGVLGSHDVVVIRFRC